jgi:hypothetical protein
MNMNSPEIRSGLCHEGVGGGQGQELSRAYVETCIDPRHTITQRGSSTMLPPPIPVTSLPLVPTQLVDILFDSR